MADLLISEDGDLQVSPAGDLALTPTSWREDVQAAYIRVMTDEGDFQIYPHLGATLSRLYGLPQSPETGQFGVELITAALNREGVFSGKPFTIKPVPTGPQQLRFDIIITSGSREQTRLSVEQNL